MKKLKCPKCKGSGFDRPSHNHSYHTCHLCDGSGTLTEKEHKAIAKKKAANK